MIDCHVITSSVLSFQFVLPIFLALFLMFLLFMFDIIFRLHRLQVGTLVRQEVSSTGDNYDYDDHYYLFLIMMIPSPCALSCLATLAVSVR